MAELDFRKRLINQIGDRISKERDNLKLTPKQTIQGDKIGEGGYGPGYIKDIEAKRIYKEERKRGRVYRSLRGCWRSGVLCTIGENLNIPFDKIIFGDRKNIEKNVRWIFNKVAYNFGENLYPESISDKNFYIVKYPNFENTTQEFWDFLMFDAELCNRYEGYRFDELLGLLDPFFENTFEEDVSFYQKKMNLKKTPEKKEVYKRQIDILGCLERRKRVHRQNNFHEHAFSERNIGFSERFTVVLNWVWKKESERFIESFKKEFVNDAINKFGMANLNKKIESWISKQFFEIVEKLKSEYSKQEVLGIGYQISDLYSQREDIWLEQNFTPNSEVSKIKKEIGINYEDQIADLTEFQERYLKIEEMCTEVPSTKLRSADLTEELPKSGDSGFDDYIKTFLSN